MKKRAYLLVLAVFVLCGAVGLGSADRSWADDDFYVIAASSGTFRGNWAATTTYNARDIVFYNGSSWFSLVGPNQNQAPDANLHLLDHAGSEGGRRGDRRQRTGRADWAHWSDRATGTHG